MSIKIVPTAVSDLKKGDVVLCDGEKLTVSNVDFMAGFVIIDFDDGTASPPLTNAQWVDVAKAAV